MADQPALPSRPEGTPKSQIFARKSIDKLISDSERPEHALKKTLGPVSLTALGIGAVIGSGIFTVIGTAIAGQQFPTASIENTPLIDYFIRHTAMVGRPGSGPAPLRRASTVGAGEFQMQLHRRRRDSVHASLHRDIELFGVRI